MSLALEPLRDLPDALGHFGEFGGQYVPETLIPVLAELECAYIAARDDPAFEREIAALLADYVGRPTPLYRADRLAAALGGRLRLYLKREDLCHTGAHKINNTIGQGVLARRLGKRKVIAETGAGQHGVATATVAALLGLDCIVYMGQTDMVRQRLNVARMRLLGAEVRAVTSGTATLKDATNEAMRHWMRDCDDTHYIIGSVVGPHPFPMMVRDLQSVIGREARDQVLRAEGRLPDYLVACVGGGSNSLGLFAPFYDDPAVRFVGVEAAGHGLASGQHSLSIQTAQVGVFHGSKSYVLQTDDGQIVPAHSISAGLDYPGVGPEHSFYAASGRARYVGVTDDEALDGVRLLARTEGIIPALESAHAVHALRALARDAAAGAVVILNLSGRGDKDMTTLVEAMGLE